MKNTRFHNEIFVRGTVTLDNKRSTGGAVFSPNVIFLFHFNPAVITGALLGGLFGAIIAMAISKQSVEKHAEQNVMADEDEVKMFSSSVKKQLQGVTTYVRIPRSSIMNIEQSWKGFSFLTTDGKRYTINAWASKQRMRSFLQEHGYNVPLA